jgi:hypothetical protein
MSTLLWNGNLYTQADPAAIEVPRIDEFVRTSTTPQLTIVTIRTDDFAEYWEQPAQPIIPDILAPTPTPVTPVIAPPVLTPSGDPTPVPQPTPETQASVPEPSALWLVGPGLALVFVGSRRSRRGH